MARVDFIGGVHRSTKRDYVGRVLEADKAECAEKALQWGRDYWDGDRRFGYGGYRYDGRWRAVAEKIVEHYQLPDDASILDVGCGKAFLLYEFTQVLPRARVAGVDISQYAVENSKPEVRSNLTVASAANLPFEEREFDLVYSINALHNLYIQDLFAALREIQRVGRRHRYVCVESYRNEAEKVNLMYWQLTCRAFHTPEEWDWIFQQAGYEGDSSFIYFE